MTRQPACFYKPGGNIKLSQTVFLAGNLSATAIFSDAKAIATEEIGKQYTVADLVEPAAEGEYQGQRTIKIKMKNGRTLTIFVEIDGKWYADTLWFR